MNEPADMNEPFLRETCPHNERDAEWRVQDEGELGHWHRIILGKEVCGAMSSDYCWDMGDENHAACRWMSCVCTCHKENLLLELRECLNL